MDTLRYIMICAILKAHVSEGTDCIRKYTNEPLIGFHCDINYHAYYTNIEHHHCTERCMTDPRCWVLSYNSVNESCSLGAEPCAVADVHPDTLLVIYRDSLNEHCVTWIPPFNDPGYMHFTKRLVQTFPHHGYQYALGRMIRGSDIHLGSVASPGEDVGAFFAIDRVDEVHEPTNYELLSVGPRCTLVWLPYKAGDVMPPGALKLGYVSGEGHSYGIRVYLADINSYGYGIYMTGDSVGYYTYHGVQTLIEMEILAQIWHWTL